MMHTEGEVVGLPASQERPIEPADRATVLYYVTAMLLDRLVARGVLGRDDVTSMLLEVEDAALEGIGLAPACAGGRRFAGAVRRLCGELRAMLTGAEES